MGGTFKVFTDIENLMTMTGVLRKEGKHTTEEDLGIIKKAALITHNGKIVWVGPQKKIPKKYFSSNFKKKIKEISLKCNTVLPGFIECHTHSVFAGSRDNEFELRNQGVTYQEIARKGGGIISTVKATRSATKKELLETFQLRAQNFLQQGVTTLETKSGYALNKKDELKLLEIPIFAQQKKLTPIRIINTFLGAHARPTEFTDFESYIEFLLKEVLPLVKKNNLSHRVDIFVEEGFFQRDLAEKYLVAAQQMGFDLVIHADQLSLSGGSELAVRLEARSADHLIQISDYEIKKLADSSVTCVLLPIADLYMKSKYPPARKLIDAGARVALATDFNPGSSPSQDLQLVGLLARLEMKMSLPEVIGAYTVGAAFALNKQNECGVLASGYSADFLCTDLDWSSLFYHIGKPCPSSVYIDSVMRYKI